MSSYHDRVEEVRDEMRRDADTARGLGVTLGPADLDYYLDEMNHAEQQMLEDDYAVEPELVRAGFRTLSEQERRDQLRHEFLRGELDDPVDYIDEEE